MPQSALKYNPAIFDTSCNIVHELVISQGVGETILCLERVVGTFLIEGHEEPATAEDIQMVRDCTRISDLLGRVRESAEVKRVDRRGI
jgi:hypothetical protein